MTPDNRIAVCPGSYDPITNGHLDVIARAAELFDEVIVAVVNLSIRKGKHAVRHRRAPRVHRGGDERPGQRPPRAVRHAGRRLRQRVGAKAIVKGLRAISDFEYELEMNQLNRMQAPEIDTLYLMASPQYSFLSSSGVKELATFGGNIDELVPRRVAVRLKEELAR